MPALELALLVLGTGLLVAGYRRDDRRMLATSAIVLLLAGTGVDFATGVVDGFRDAAARHVAG